MCEFGADDEKQKSERKIIYLKKTQTELNIK